jgi:hypothetical protein
MAVSVNKTEPAAGRSITTSLIPPFGNLHEASIWRHKLHPEANNCLFHLRKASKHQGLLADKSFGRHGVAGREAAAADAARAGAAGRVFAEEPSTKRLHAYREYKPNKRRTAKGHRDGLLADKPGLPTCVGVAKSEGQWRDKLAAGGQARGLALSAATDFVGPGSPVV